MTERIRHNNVETLTIASGEALSGEFDFSLYAGGLISVDGWTAANISFKISSVSGGTFAEVYDAGSIVEITNVTAGKWHPIPSEFWPMKFAKVWSKNTGSAADVNQAAERTITIILKA